MSDVARTPASRWRPCRRSSTGGTAWPRRPWTASSRSSTSSATRRASGAQSLRSHRTNVLGILVAEFEPFSTELLKGASRAVARHRLRAARLLRRRPRGRRRLGAALPVAAVRHAHRRRRHRHADRGGDQARASTSSRSTRTPGRPGCRPSTPTTSPAPCWRRTTCSASATAASASSAAAPTWSRPGCARPASARRWPTPASPVDEALVRVGGYRTETADGTGPRTAHPRRPADRGLRRQRPLGDRHDGRRPRAWA